MRQLLVLAVRAAVLPSSVRAEEFATTKDAELMVHQAVAFMKKEGKVKALATFSDPAGRPRTRSSRRSSTSSCRTGSCWYEARTRSSATLRRSRAARRGTAPARRNLRRAPSLRVRSAAAPAGRLATTLRSA
jgi:hypothetical protein